MGISAQAGPAPVINYDTLVMTLKARTEWRVTALSQGRILVSLFLT